MAGTPTRFLITTPDGVTRTADLLTEAVTILGQLGGAGEISWGAQAIAHRTADGQWVLDAPADDQ